MDVDGNVRSIEKIERTEHKVYKGDAFVQRHGEEGWSKAGWARISIHRDGKHPVFDGSFRIDGDNHHISSAAHYQHLRHSEDPVLPPQNNNEETMVVWRDSDVQTFASEHGELKRDLSQQSICNSDTLDFNAKQNADLRRSNPFQAIDSRSLFGRQTIDGGGSGNGAGTNLVDSIGSLSGCPTTRKVALVGIATDCTYWDGFNSSEALRKNVISMVNKASEVYESTFKISLGIKNLTILDKGCPGTPSSVTPWNVDCGPSTSISDRLSLFSAWRGKSQDKNAYWSLLTRCPTESAVGLAWRGQLCRQGAGASRDGNGNNETVASANVVVRTSTEWQIFAHETGHTFGAVHDCTSATCPGSSNPDQVCCPLTANTCDAGGKFIMNPSTGSEITRFSACSIGNICSGLKAGVMGSCLTDNKNVEIVTESQCGNGIVESGEDCDCGGEAGCKDNPCCDAKTCKFKGASVCDPSNEDCCTDQCKFASSGTVCRASTGECDLEEKCPGDIAKCPGDEHKNDGDSCGSTSDLKCASGQCTSRDRQCQLVAGGLAGNNNMKDCPDTRNSCEVTCALRNSNERQCVVYSQNFIDGTPCAGGGHCSNGRCRGSSTTREIADWITSHKSIVIPIAAVVGVLLLLAVGSCILSCITKARRKRRAPKTPPEMSGWPAGRNEWSRDQSRSPGGATGYGMNGLQPSGDYPPVPNHTYSPMPDDYPQPNRSRSMRYA